MPISPVENSARRKSNHCRSSKWSWKSSILHSGNKYLNNCPALLSIKNLRRETKTSQTRQYITKRWSVINMGKVQRDSKSFKIHIKFIKSLQFFAAFTSRPQPVITNWHFVCQNRSLIPNYPTFRLINFPSLPRTEQKKIWILSKNWETAISLTLSSISCLRTIAM